MNKIYQIITLLLLISISACVSSQSNMTASNDEDKDIGLGGTGMLANSANTNGDSSGMGGTGIIGEITGYGSIFVNGIEVEYDNDTAFSIDGKTAAPQQLEIGDVVEILTVDAKQHTQAQVINLRHEIIGVVESVEAHTYSFTVNGQSIIQSIEKPILPEIGTTVAVAGFRLDEKTILSTRVTTAKTGQLLLRSHTGLPFDKQAKRWLIQTHVQNNQATFEHDGETHAFTLDEKTDKSFKDQLGIKILQLQESATEKLVFKQVIEQADVPRGRRLLNPMQPQDGSMLQRTMPGTNSGAAPGSGIKTNSGSTSILNQTKGKQNGNGR